MPKIFKRKELWGSIIAVVILAYCFKDVGREDLLELYHRANLYYFVPALIAEFCWIIAKAYRWRVIVESHKELPIARTIFMFSAGQVINVAMPALTGQVGRVLLFSKKSGLSKTFVFSTVVLETLFDAISMLIIILFLSMAFVFPSEYRSVSYIIAIATISCFVLLYLVLTFKDQLGTLGRRTLRRRWPATYITLRKFSHSFTQGISLLRSTKYFSRTLLTSFIGWFFHILAIYFLLYTFGIELHFMAAMVIMIVNMLLLMIPITPGNAGTFELAVVASLAAFGVHKSDAVLYALALHIADFIPVFVMGLLFLRREKTSIQEIQEEGEQEDALEETAAK